MTTLAFMVATPRRRLVSAFGIALLAWLLVLAAGFAWFLHLTGRSAATPQHADGIVAFTGGPERVETALRLLAEGRAERLLLSGIGGGAELSELARLAGVDALPIATRVTIGRHAATTRGNALETADWVHGNDVHSLLVVTADYHMPRAMTELRRVLPDITLYPVPIALRPGRSGAPLRLLLDEYVKFLASAIGLTSILPEREAPPMHGHAG